MTVAVRTDWELGDLVYVRAANTRRRAVGVVTAIGVSLVQVRLVTALYDWDESGRQEGEGAVIFVPLWELEEVRA